MNKQVVFLLLSTCIVILSVAIIAVGPMTNSIHGQSWGYQNCALISDKIKLLKGDVTKWKIYAIGKKQCMIWNILLL